MSTKNTTKTITSAKEYYKYAYALYRARDRRFRDMLLDAQSIISPNEIIEIKRKLQKSRDNNQFGPNFYKQMEILSLDSPRFSSQYHNPTIKERLSDFKINKKRRLDIERYKLNTINPILEMDFKKSFKTVRRNMSYRSSFSIHNKLNEFFMDSRGGGMLTHEEDEFVQKVVDSIERYRESKHRGESNHYYKKSAQKRKREDVIKSHAEKKYPSYPSAEELINKIIDTVQNMTASDIKQATFGKDCNTNLKVVARESSKPTLDNTTNHNIDVSDLQEVSVLVKWVQQQGKNPITYEILDGDSIHKYNDRDLHDLISHDNSNSCHRYNGEYSRSPIYLLSHGVKVLRFNFNKNKFLRFYFIEMGKGIAQSDAYYFTTSGNAAVNGGNFTFPLLAKMSGIQTNNPFKASVESDGSSTVYINDFDTFIGLPKGSVELIPEDDEDEEDYCSSYTMCAYSGNEFIMEENFYNNCMEVLLHLEDELDIKIPNRLEFDEYVLYNNVRAWIDCLDIPEEKLKELGETRIDIMTRSLRR